jgi:hypothetical protein
VTRTVSPTAEAINKTIPTPKLDTDPFGDLISPGETKRFSPLQLTVAPRQDFPALISEDDIKKARIGEWFIQVGIAFVYRDGFGNKRSSQRWFVWEPKTDLFRICGSLQD